MSAVEGRGNSPKEGLGPESIDDNMSEMMFHKRGCCFWIPCLGSDRSNKLGSPSPWWERVGTSDNHEERWWNKAVLKVREWSEIMAGPKWKTFIRRFNKKNGGGSGGGGASGGGSGGGSLLLGGGKQRKFQYDPLSYSLNFDEGPGHNGQSDEDYVFRDFSSRYATIPISAKSSMDLGKAGPTFS